MSVSRAILRLVPPLRRSLDQVPAYAEQWRAANEVAGTVDGPLWVVVGDSTAQAIGVARGIGHGYVGRVRRQLELRDGRPWRVLNLSRSGAVLADVLAEQLPLAPLGADLVTCVVGGNDLRRTPLDQLLTDLRAVVAALPDGAVIATMPRGLKEAKAVRVNALLQELVAGRALTLADLWSTTGPPWRGKYADGLHPNEVGLTDWVRALSDALGLPPEPDPPVRPARH